MKAAVAHLEQFMEKAETATRGKILLATVKGDVHDIGKNLVEIILANNGYEVVNLGIKVPPEELIAAVPRAQAGRHRPLRPAGEVARSRWWSPPQDLRAAGIEIPLLRRRRRAHPQVHRDRGSPPAYGGVTLYAKDAMDGLDLANQLFSAATRDALRRARPPRAGGPGRGRRWSRAGAGERAGGADRPGLARGAGARPRPTSSCTSCATCR